MGGTASRSNRVPQDHGSGFTGGQTFTINRWCRTESGRTKRFPENCGLALASFWRGARKPRNLIQPMPHRRDLLIVSTDRQDIYDLLKQDLGARFEVILNRRRGDRRSRASTPTENRRGGERRSSYGRNRP